MKQPELKKPFRVDDDLSILVRLPASNYIGGFAQYVFLRDLGFYVELEKESSNRDIDRQISQGKWHYCTDKELREAVPDMFLKSAMFS